MKMPCLFACLFLCLPSLLYAQDGVDKRDGATFQIKVPDSDFMRALLCDLVGVDPQDKQAVKNLIKIIERGDRRDRLTAINAVAEFNEKASGAIGPLLTVILEEDDTALGEAAARALGAISSRGNLACKILLEAMRNKRGRIRGRAALGLGLVSDGNREVLAALLPGLRDKDRSVRLNVARAFSTLSDRAKSVLPQLLAGMKDQDGLPLVELAGAIGFIDLSHIPPQAISILVRSLKAEKDEKVRARAAEILGELGRSTQLREGTQPWRSAVHGALVNATGDECEQVRLLAIVAIGEMGYASNTGVMVLTHALKDPSSDIRIEAAIALRRSGLKAKAAVPALKFAVRNDSNTKVRVYAAEVLWIIDGHSPQWVTTILGFLANDADPDVRHLALLALIFLDLEDPRVKPAIKQACSDDDPGVRRSARTYFETLGKQ